LTATTTTTPAIQNQATLEPAPVVNIRPLKGAWGQQAPPPPQPAVPSPAALAVEAPLPTPSLQSVEAVSAPPVPVPVPVPIEEKAKPVTLHSTSDPTPSGLLAPSASKPVLVTGGNVWATKGSAHLIMAEKPKPKPVPPPPSNSSKSRNTAPAVKNEPSIQTQVEETLSQNHSDESTLEGLPASVTGANINAQGWKPQGTTQPEPSPVVVHPSPILAPVAVSTDLLKPPELEVQQSPRKSNVDLPPPPVVPTNVLNMGQWGDGENDDSHTLDFGFGSFSHDADGVSVDEANNTGMSPSEPALPKETGVSPARPPPGLSISGMPPMPANAVLVHELEKTLDNATLDEKTNEEKAQASSSNTAAQGTHPPPPPGVAAHILPQNYNAAYGMTGMYTYNAAAAATANGGYNMQHGGAPGLAGGVPQHQKPQAQPAQQQQPPSSTAQGGAPQHLQLPPQGGLYGASAASSTGNDTTATPVATDAATAAAGGGIPPGMPGATMAYNPALFYGQQPYQMGQPHGGVGYGYGYGQQFGAVQGGFGYQQVMTAGQASGVSYGQPYDDAQQQQQPQQQHSGHPSSTHNSSGYNQNKSNQGGGYRGRNHHGHNNHGHTSQQQQQHGQQQQQPHGQQQHSQYNSQQAQYNPQQHGGYGGQPYNMGYANVDQHIHHSQAYGRPGNMGDPYAMSAGGYAGGQTGAMSSGFAGQEEGGDQGSASGGGNNNKKGGNGRGRGGPNKNNSNSGSNPNLQQFQQPGGQQQPQQGQQPPFGLQAGGDATPTTGASNAGGGWSNNPGWGAAPTGWQG